MEPKDAAQSSSLQRLLGSPVKDLLQKKQFKQIQRRPATQMSGKSLNCASSTPPASIKQLAAEFQKMHRTGVKYSTESGNQSKWHNLPTAPGKQERSTLRCFQALLQQILSFSWQSLPKTGAHPAHWAAVEESLLSDGIFNGQFGLVLYFLTYFWTRKQPKSKAN